MTATPPPGGEVLRLALRGAAASEVVRAQAAVVEFLAAHGARPRSVARAELLIEEVALNTLRHGYPEGQEPALDIVASIEGGRCVLQFEDRGIAFDPTAAPLPAPAAGLAEARIGGLGITLIRRTAAELSYERMADGRNRLRMVLPADEAGTG
ncbi:ATP-binding protein [Neoroseomonas soli]|uniref:ATP-binding protein n=1 Tax=Neoroseomonas soli TaxID=1081025 RepID=A0A9X9WSS0_9PROT|nr:ATP-binding protein [Neoroseomonas soli]MBR0670199.1 ATP-binding protein [Neoroseomonas soli]